MPNAQAYLSDEEYPLWLRACNEAKPARNSHNVMCELLRLKYPDDPYWSKYDERAKANGNSFLPKQNGKASENSSATRTSSDGPTLQRSAAGVSASKPKPAREDTSPVTRKGNSLTQAFARGGS